MSAGTVGADVADQRATSVQCQLVLQQARRVPPDRPGVVPACDLVPQHLRVGVRPVVVKTVEQILAGLSPAAACCHRTRTTPSPCHVPPTPAVGVPQEERFWHPCPQREEVRANTDDLVCILIDAQGIVHEAQEGAKTTISSSRTITLPSAPHISLTPAMIEPARPRYCGRSINVHDPKPFTSGTKRPHCLHVDSRGRVLRTIGENMQTAMAGIRVLRKRGQYARRMLWPAIDKQRDRR